MTLTSKSMEWLNCNRSRSYPMKRDEWREKVSPTSGLDCVLLDAIVFNCNSSGTERLVLSSISVSDDSTHVVMDYGGAIFSIELSGGGSEEGFEHVRIIPSGDLSGRMSMSFVFSCHDYIVKTVGRGSWDIGAAVLESRIVNLQNGFGVDGISTNGSSGIEGMEEPAVASGDVVLEDGYRTSPIIKNGEVLVRVGKKYGKDPCHYDYGKNGGLDCASPLFFFCGQNAINSGNVTISGGRGVTVKQGGKYTVKDGDLEGKDIPCIEIIADSELLDLYKPGECELEREAAED